MKNMLKYAMLVAHFTMALPVLANAQFKKVETPVQAIDMKAQERLGGHTIARHVGKDASFIKDRIVDEGIPAGGTFRDLGTAQASVQAALAANKKEINEHLFNACKGEARQVYQYNAGHNIGSYLETGSLQDKRGRERNSASGKALKTGATSMKLVLKYDCSARPPTFFILTAFPIPPR
jgi:hypothetical protein